MSEPIAIIGVGLRFPGGNTTLDGFADFLRNGRSGVGPVPDDRWDVAAFAPADEGDKGKIHTAGGGFLDRIDEFDAPFFNISPKEADFVDPQQRLLLETTWEALENATINPAPLRGGNGGVYVGASSVDYALESIDLELEELDGHLAAGTTVFPLSGRLSYFLGWRGPCMTVDTACSSSLTALHLAVSGLRAGECDIALCAGVNAIHHPRVLVTFSHAKMLAPDGRCKTFDEAADGYVRAEGCGVLVLKRLSTAERDGDEVLGLVRGTAVGQDGDSAGLTVPNGIAQEAVIRTALARAALTPGDISYVEAHGTGTALGDPIEMGAINDVFGDAHTKAAPLTVASVKTNLGHMEPASGVAAVVKTVAQMRDRLIYPHLNFVTPSGRIPWDAYPVTVPTECVPWTAPVRRAVVNSFGFAGTIAATVLEEAPRRETPPPAPPDGAGEVFTLSAKTRAGMRRQLETYGRFLADHPDADVRDVCYTTNVGRNHFGVRMARVVADTAELGAHIAKELAKPARERRRSPRKVGFLFAGQGAQYAGMGRAAYDQYQVFRETVDECDRLFAPHLGRSIRELMLDETPGAEALLNQTGFTQPALFTLEYALARLWLSWGVRPNTMIGHSIGEVVAATVAEVFSLPDAVKLVAARARLMQSVRAPGGMTAVAAPAAGVAPLLDGIPDLAIAAINSPRQCVISGGLGSLAKVEEELTVTGVRVTRLSVSHAFHSPLMAEVFDEFRTVLKEIRFGAPTLTLVSNLTGAVARAHELAMPEYWVRHIGEPVDFTGGMSTLGGRGGHVLIEIGPSTALTSLGRQCEHAADHTWVTSMTRSDAAGRTLRTAVAGAYASGLAISWPAFHRGRQGRRVQLPTYAFDRRSYWLPNRANRHGRGTGGHPLLGRETTLPDQRAGGVREFTAPLADAVTAAPAAAFLEMLWALQDVVYGERRQIHDLRLLESPVPAEDATIRTRLSAGEAGEAVIRDAGDRILATAIMAVPAPGHADADMPPGTVPVESRDGGSVYADLAELGLDYAPGLRLLQRLDVLATPEADGEWRAVAEIGTRAAAPSEQAPFEVVAAGLQAVTALTGLVPTGVGAARLIKKPRATALRVSLRVRETADLVFYEGDRPIAELRDMTLAAPAGVTARRFLHEQRWFEQPLPEPGTPRDRRVLLLNRPADGLAGDTRVRVFAGSGTDAELRDATDVCWFWRPGSDQPGADGLRDECERNYADLLDLVARLDHAGFGRNQRLWLITERAQYLPGDPAEQQAAASLWGFGHVLLNEYPIYRVTMVDLDGRPADLLGELLATETAEFQIAHRSGRRHVRRLVPSDPAIVRTPALRPDRAYLVTGGFGALGIRSALKLAELGARHLILVSRGGAPGAESAALLKELRSRAEVTLVRSDLHDLGDLSRYRIGGIVHTAGVLADGPVTAQTKESINAVFQAKVYGTWRLHEATRSMPDLEFFVGFSSAAAALGGVTQSNYAAANAYMDDLMRRRHGHGLPGLSINWGPWSEAGMSARLSPAIRQAWDDQGIKFFTPARGLRALAGLLAAPVAQVGVGECDWNRFAAAKPIANALYDEVVAVDDRRRGVDLTALLTMEPGARRTAIEEFVLATLGSVLRSDDVDAFEPDAEFVHLGLDSLMAMELRATLEGALRMPLPASLAFDHPSAERLAEFLDRQLVPEPVS
ncbi:type I polyketide synthase [Streptosporangiaceae bacterium NEAU-GS5]|nr:type I polyketide synthase [Streptosporangiaceae bacterium NEAU-GS5]